MSLLQASEEFDVPQVLLCITTTLSPQLFPKTVSVGVLQIGWATDGRGGPFKGYPLLGRAKPPRPKEKLKAIVTRLHCHLRPALDGQKKKQTMMAESKVGMKCDGPVALSTWTPRSQKIKKL